MGFVVGYETKQKTEGGHKNKTERGRNVKRGDVEEHDTERSGCEDVGGKAGNEEGGEAGTDIRTLGGLESVSIWRVANGNVCVHSEDSPHAENR